MTYVAGMIDFRDMLHSQRGLARKIADACGINDSAVSQWRRVPAQRVLDVERVTGVPREILRPDIFGSGSSASASEGMLG